MAVQATVHFYNSKKINVYVLMLDDSKAFDRVEYCKLFKVLLGLNVSPLIMQLLIHMYTNQQLPRKVG